MFKLAFVLSVAALCSLSTVSASSKCLIGTNEIFKGINFIDMKSKCTEATQQQIKKEITASLAYLNMAAYFSRDTINRPGYAKFFFGAASEEREHAYKLIEYLSMRGKYMDKEDKVLADSAMSKINISDLLKNSGDNDILGASLEDLSTSQTSKSKGLIALKNALKLEVEVTKSIRKLVEVCEDSSDKQMNHYHFVDYLTGEFLEEQYKGQRELAGKITTLSKMIDANGAELADFLFDKEM